MMKRLKIKLLCSICIFALLTSGCIKKDTKELLIKMLQSDDNSDLPVSILSMKQMGDQTVVISTNGQEYRLTIAYFQDARFIMNSSSILEENQIHVEKHDFMDPGVIVCGVMHDSPIATYELQLEDQMNLYTYTYQSRISNEDSFIHIYHYAQEVMPEIDLRVFDQANQKLSDIGEENLFF